MQIVYISQASTTPEVLDQDGDDGITLELSPFSLEGANDYWTAAIKQCPNLECITVVMAEEEGTPEIARFDGVGAVVEIYYGDQSTAEYRSRPHVELKRQGQS